MIGRIAFASCALIAVANAQPAPDAPPEKPAEPLTKLDTSKLEALYASGTKHYNLAEWDAAIADFKQLYALMPDPTFLFNLGQAYRQKGSCREATAVYRSYLRTASDADRGRVESLISEIAPCVKTAEDNERRMQPPPPPPPAGPRLLKLGGMIAGGAGVVAAAVGVGFTIRAHGAQSDVEDACRDGCSGGEIAALDAKGRHSSRDAKVLYITGGALVAVGIAAYVYGASRKEHHVTVAPTAGGAVVFAGASF